MNYTFIFEQKLNTTVEKPVTTVVMHTCAKQCKEDCMDYKTPLNQCNNATTLFPNDPQWSDFDWYDVYRSGELVRTFYKSKYGTCSLPTETFTIPLGINVGPIGLPRSCGKFTVE